MSKQLMLVTGGAHSGKRRFARQQAEAWGGSVLYVATSQPNQIEALPAGGPPELPNAWTLIEAPLDPAAAIMANMWGHEAVVLQDLSLLTTNLMLNTPDEADEAAALALIMKQMNALIAAFAASQASWVVLTHEVGLGVVPRSRLGRHYRLLLGRVNQRWATAADAVIWMMAGLPWHLTPYTP